MTEKLDSKDYPYGEVSRTLKEAVRWLNKTPVEVDKFLNGFEYPDYFGMPKEISYKLSTDEVDWLQDELNGYLDVRS